MTKTPQMNRNNFEMDSYITIPSQYFFFTMKLNIKVYLHLPLQPLSQLRSVTCNKHNTLVKLNSEK